MNTGSISKWDLALAAGLMEAVALTLIKLPFRDHLHIPMRLVWDGFAGLMGAFTLLVVLYWRGSRIQITRGFFIPVLVLGAVYLSLSFALEILVEKILLAVGLGLITGFRNGVIGDFLCTLVTVLVFVYVYNFIIRWRKLKLPEISPTLSIYVAIYEAIFVAWQLGGLPTCLVFFQVPHHYGLVFQFFGWCVGGFFSALLVILIYEVVGIPILTRRTQ